MSRDTIYQQLRGHLAYLKLAAAAEALPNHLDQARQQDVGHTHFLEGLLRVEVEATEQQRWNGRMRFANFPTRWQLEDYATSAPSPASTKNPSGNSQQVPTSPTRPTCCTYGPPGVGKTMLAVVLGRAALDAGHRVYYTTTAADLAARCPNSRPRRTMGTNHAVLLRPGRAHSGRTRLPTHAIRGHPLRCSRSSPAATRKAQSSSPPTATSPPRGDIFSDTTIAAAMLDRLLHRSVVPTITGDSYRLRAYQAQARKQRPKRAAN